MSYNAEELQYIITLPRVIISASVGADGTLNPMNIFKELVSAGKFINDAPQNYPNNALVSKVLETLDINQESAYIEQTGSFVPADEALAFATHVSQIIQADPDAEIFKHFIFDLALEVANASGGGFLGRGEKIDQEEANFLNRLKGAFGLI